MKRPGSDPSRVAFTSTKFPTCAPESDPCFGSQVREGPTRAKGAMLTAARITEKGSMTVPSPIETPASMHVRWGARCERRAQMLVHDAALQEVPARRGELGRAVDAGDLSRIRGGDEPDHAAGGPREAEDVGQVVLALRVLRVRPSAAARSSARALEDVDAGVDLADRARRLVRVLFLDDPEQAALGVAHDAAEPCRVRGRRR